MRESVEGRGKYTKAKTYLMWISYENIVIRPLNSQKEQKNGLKEETQKTERCLSNQDLFGGHSTSNLEKVGSFQRYNP
jgi:hypothetical protein